MNEEELTKEDILSVTGSIFATMLDYVENSDKEINKYKKILTELEEWLNENIKLKPLQTTYFFEIDSKQKSISEIELNELKRVLDKIQKLKEKYK